MFNFQDATNGSNAPSGANRRQLLKRAGWVGAAAIGASLIGRGGGNVAAAAESAVFGPKAHRFHVNDFDIANFALNLEYLEAEFYQRAAFGAGLSDADATGVGTLGTVTGGSKVPFSNPLIAQYAQEIAEDELNHVRAFRSLLAARAVARPAIDLQASFTAAARAAGVVGPGGTFDPFSSDENFLLGAYIFEDVGVTAYHGAAQYIKSDLILSAASGVLPIEAYHAGAIRTLLLGLGQSNPALITAANLIATLRSEASQAGDGVPNTDEGITYSDGTTNLVPADGNSIAFGRSFSALLNIVYLNTQPTGGFFPNGLNGRIH